MDNAYEITKYDSLPGTNNAVVTFYAKSNNSTSAGNMTIIVYVDEAKIQGIMENPAATITAPQSSLRGFNDLYWAGEDMEVAGVVRQNEYVRFKFQIAQYSIVNTLTQIVVSFPSANAEALIAPATAVCLIGGMQSQECIYSSNTWTIKAPWSVASFANSSTPLDVEIRTACGFVLTNFENGIKFTGLGHSAFSVAITDNVGTTTFPDIRFQTFYKGFTSARAQLFLEHGSDDSSESGLINNWGFYNGLVVEVVT
jgi:hypothetical protein